jgi:selenocysteine-specific elongation factor
VKQRMPIKLHIGTAEVMGRIVFFDRNELKEENGEILCQLRLEEEILTKRGDRFILRRPSPQETVGGGWVIDPRGNKYRFGNQTIEELEKKKVGTPKERVISVLFEAKSLPIHELIKRSALDEETLAQVLNSEEFVLFNGKEYTLHTIIHSIEEDIYDRLQEYHLTHTMKAGINKAEILQTMQKRFSKPLLEFVVENGITNGVFSRKGQFVLLSSFTPNIPKNWQKRVENMISEIKYDGLKVRYFNDYLKDAGLPDNLVGDIKKFLEEQGMIVMLDDQFAYHGEIFNDAVEKLRNNTGVEFEVGDAKEVLDLSRKYMIPFLERLDLKGLTKRVENKRVWQ